MAEEKQQSRGRRSSSVAHEIYYRTEDTDSKHHKGEGKRVSVIQFVREDPIRVEFEKKFKVSEEFRKRVGYEPSASSIEDFLKEYRKAANAPGKNIKKKDLDEFVTESLWTKGTLLGLKPGGKILVRTTDGTEKLFSKKDTSPWDPQHDADVIAEDVAMIKGFGEASLLVCMRRRLTEIYNVYTYVSDILLCLNPYMQLPEMANIAEYPNQINYVLKTNPHIYGVAHMAYWGLLKNQTGDGKPDNRSCVVSGESGAGKTYMCSMLMKYLAKLSTWRTLAKTSGERGEENGTNRLRHRKSVSSGVTALVGGVSPFLEAFGNAKTNMNDNSSRFGKFTKIFMKDGNIVGAEMDHYLLEKSRIVSQGRNERNYHIFYFLLRGCTAEERANYFDNKLSRPIDYPKLWEGWLQKGSKAGTKRKKDPKLEDVTLIGHGHGEEYDVEKMNNPLAEDPDKTGVRAALTMANVSEKRQQDMWRIVAGVLRMTNLKFRKDPKIEDAGTMKSTGEANAIARLLGLKDNGKDGFAELLCCEIMVVRNKEIRKTRTVTECEDNANTLAKEIYRKLFAWLIEGVCNVVLKPNDASAGSSDLQFVGLLDIFGFENFTLSGGTNSIEQLCINFANEKLQYLFNQHVFDDEKAMYADDGIDPSMMPSGKNNKACIDLVERKGKRLGSSSGMFRLLSEFVKTPAAKKPNRNRCLVALWKKKFGAKKNEVAKNAKERWVKASSKRFFGDIKHDLRITIRHYAGDIRYDVSGWLEKNVDKLPKQLLKVVETSSFDFLRGLFVDGERDGVKKKKKRGSGKVPKDLCGKYLHQLGELSETLRATYPHYVRCVKPNDFHFTAIDGRSAFDAYKTHRQLLYAGVMEVVKIKKMGFPFRENLDTFWADCVERGFPRFMNPAPSGTAKECVEQLATLVLKKPKTVPDHLDSSKTRTKYFWVVGRTKMWGSDGTEETLNTWLLNYVSEDIQSWWRFRGAYRQRLAEFLRAKRSIQRRWKIVLIRRKMQKMLPNMVKIQRMTRTVLAIRLAMRHRTRSAACVRVQRFLRGKRLLKYSHDVFLVLRVQMWFRLMRSSLEWRDIADRAELLQAGKTWNVVARTALRDVLYETTRGKLLSCIRKHKSACTIQKVYRRYRMQVRFRSEMNRVARALSNLNWIRASSGLFAVFAGGLRAQFSRLERQRDIDRIVQQYEIWKIQSVWATMRLAVIVVQKHVRGLLARLRAHRRRYLITRMQAFARIGRWLNRYVKKHRRVVLIQRWWRRIQIRNRTRKYRVAAKLITREYFHRILLRRKRRRWVEAICGAARRGDIGDLASLLLLDETFDFEGCDERYRSYQIAGTNNRTNVRSLRTGETLLHLAVRSGDLATVRYLTRNGQGTWVSEVDASGATPLHVSCEEGDANFSITVHLLRLLKRANPVEAAVRENTGITAGGATDALVLLVRESRTPT
eukprot:g2816.t1